MKNVFTCLVTLLLATPVMANDFYSLNMSNQLESMTFSIYGLCSPSHCKGVTLTVPTASRLSIEQVGNAGCSIKRASTLRYQGGDSYVIATKLKLNSTEACRVIVKDKYGSKVKIRLINAKASFYE